MFKKSQLGRWARREAILASVLALAAALVAFGKFLNSNWLIGAGLIAALVGAAVRVVVARGKAGAEANIETLGRRRRIRVPVSRLREVEPTDVGVDAAPEQSVLPGGDIPQYVSREADKALDAALAGAADGDGPWIVIAVGNSKVGKSRSLFEALRRYAERSEVDFIAPVDSQALNDLLAPGELPELTTEGAIVLWLDDIEPFINQGMTIETLREWRERYRNCIVTGTYGGKGSALVSSSAEGGLGTIASQVLQRACEIQLGMTTLKEIEPLRAGASGHALALIEKHGLAAYLVAGPELLRKLTTRRHEPGDRECPEGLAIVYAAVDWARCGRTDPLPGEVLKELWTDYLPAGTPPRPDGFEVGLEWALKPVAGSIALLEYLDSYRAYDYVIRLVANQPEGLVHRDSIWKHAIKGASDAQAFSVGVSAFARDRFEDAAAAFALAANSSIAVLSGISTFNLGVTYWKLNRFIDEQKAYDDIVERFGGAEDPTLREVAAKALVNKGLQQGKSGRHEDALATFEEAVERFGEANEPELRNQVAKALLNKGIALGRLDRPQDEIATYDEVVEHFASSDEHVATALVNKGTSLAQLDHSEQAIEVYEEVVERFDGVDEPKLRVEVARALFNKGVRLGTLNRPEGEIAAYDETVERIGESTDPELRGLAAKSLVNKGMILRKLDQPEQAVEVFEEVVKLFDDAKEPELRDQVTRALLSLGLALDGLNRPQDEIAAYDEVVSRVGESTDPELCERAAKALVNKGLTLDELEDPGEAVVTYEEVIDRFGETNDLGLLRQIAKALLAKSVALSKLDQPAEEIAACEEVIQRFNDSEDSVLREYVAGAVSALGRDEEVEEESLDDTKDSA